MQLVLTTWDRVTLMKAASGLRNVSTYHLRSVLRFIDKMDLDEEEEKAVGFMRMGAGFQWRDTLRTWIIDLDSHDVELLGMLKDEVTKFTWTGGEAREALELFDKVGIDIEEIEANATEPTTPPLGVAD